jgi:hypothetical protein
MCHFNNELRAGLQDVYNNYTYALNTLLKWNSSTYDVRHFALKSQIPKPKDAEMQLDQISKWLMFIG